MAAATNVTRIKAGLAVFGMLLVAAPSALAAPNDTTLASRASGATGAKADASAFNHSMSATGRYVVFSSGATNLGGGGIAGAEAYRRDRVSGATTHVSLSSAGTPMNALLHQARAPRVSADGNYVVFYSNSDVLHGDDVDTTNDIFLRDVGGSATQLLSRASGGAKGNGDSTGAVISANGRYVAFTSASTNLGADADVDDDVFVRDLQTDTTILASRATGAAGAPSDGLSYVTDISADGRYVVFYSNATNLDGADTNFLNDVYVRDIVADTTTLVSRNDAGIVGNADSSFGTISDDGRYLSFQSVSTNLSVDDADATDDVFVRDTVAGVTKLASRATGLAGAKGDASSTAPAISGDGRYLSFESLATNLATGDTNAVGDVFHRDLQTGTTLLLSRASGANGAVADGQSFQPSISTDGLTVVFGSTATNLHGDDADASSDVYVREVPPPPAPPAAGCAPTNSCFTNTNPTVGAVPRVCPDGNSLKVTCILRGNGIILIRGTNAGDTLVGRPGSDIIYGYGGKDTIIGDRGTDKLFGRAGRDELYGGQGDDFLLGGDGADVIDGGTGNDQIGGGKGNDQLRGGYGKDKITGGDGNDKIWGDDGRDYLIGGRGHDNIWGGSGNDRVLGDLGNDRLYGEQGVDSLFGGRGNDMMWGGTQDDFLWGQWGNDQLFGEQDHDRLRGGPGKDKLVGGVGRDWLFRSRGGDSYAATNFDRLI